MRSYNFDGNLKNTAFNNLSKNVELSITLPRVSEVNFIIWVNNMKDIKKRISYRKTCYNTLVAIEPNRLYNFILPDIAYLVALYI